MTSQQSTTIARIQSQLDAQRFAAAQAAREGAALSGALGVQAQLLAMSELYRELRAEGRIDEARAVKAEAIKLYEGSK